MNFMYKNRACISASPVLIIFYSTPAILNIMPNRVHIISSADNSSASAKSSSVMLSLSQYSTVIVVVFILSPTFSVYSSPITSSVSFLTATADSMNSLLYSARSCSSPLTVTVPLTSLLFTLSSLVPSRFDTLP